MVTEEHSDFIELLLEARKRMQAKQEEKVELSPSYIPGLTMKECFLYEEVQGLRRLLTKMVVEEGRETDDPDVINVYLQIKKKLKELERQTVN